LDFAILPPEVNSGRMYAGPGSGPLLAAAQAWNGLADELYSAASAYQSVVSELTGQSWSGPSAAAMTAAAMSYVSWLSSAAAQAEQTAAQANAAVAAYETAFMSTVPPPVIAANRSLLMTLVTTNFFGQNTSAIAATEADYAQMWAQDAATMYGYAGWSAAATRLTPFTSPQQNTDPGDASSQTTAVRQALTTSAGNAQNSVSAVSQTFSAVPDALQSLATSAAPGAGPSSSSLNTLSNLITIIFGVPDALAGLSASLPLAILAGPVDLPFAIGGYLSGVHADDILSGWAGQESWPGNGPAPITELPATLTNRPPGVLSAGLGGANTVGGLSVPSSWTGTAPEIRPIALTLPAVTAASPLEAGSAITFNDMGLAGMSGQAMAGPPEPAGDWQSGKAVTRPRAAARATGAPADGEGKASQHNPRIVVTGVAAAIREIAKLRDQGSLTHEEFLEQRNRLLGR
jgi:PPE-repeat protein